MVAAKINDILISEQMRESHRKRAFCLILISTCCVFLAAECAGRNEIVILITQYPRNQNAQSNCFILSFELSGIGTKKRNRLIDLGFGSLLVLDAVFGPS